MGKRGFVDVHEVDKVEGKIPASEVRGWVKELRSMGLEVELKFKDYEEAVGVDPQKLIRQ